jgi:ribosomal protein S12 methylthiotransferase
MPQPAKATEHEPASRPLRVAMICLGCAKNLVDAEIMLGALKQQGIELTHDAAAADALVVNTCAFIDAAQEESVDAILESDHLRQAKQRGQALIVAGCLPQRFRQQLPKLLPEVDAFVGVDQVTQIPELVRQAVERRAQRLASQQPACPAGNGRFATTQQRRPGSPGQPSQHRPLALKARQAQSLPRPVVAVSARPRYIPDWTTPRVRLTPSHYAYVKIAEGCNHPCSFCVIPQVRGPYRSRPMADILHEARRLIAAGVKELNLISQDTTYYGLDLWPRPRPSAATPERFAAAQAQCPAEAPTLARLLRQLDALPGQFWIRLLYTHPAHWTDELIQTIADCSKVVRYIDLPLQHIHPTLLERMRRETSAEYLMELIGRLRARLPGVALRTTFIVGFPGETEACFQRLLEFVRQTRFERLGVFTYSKEAGTRAARMQGQVPARVKRTRRDLLMATQRQIARQIAAASVGRTLQVLVERPAAPDELQVETADYMVARSAADAPEIDGRVYVRGRLPVGEFALVKVVGHTDYDLIAEPA